MVMPQLAHPTEWTRDRVLDLPDDGKRYELVAGTLLVSPSPRPRHQDVVRLLVEHLAPYVRHQSVGRLFFSPSDLELRPGELFQPDVFVVPPTPGGPPREWSGYDRPILVIEVASPSTARYDRAVKRVAFQEVGIPEYWIVDPDARLVERWRPGDDRPEVLLDQLEWAPPGASEPLRIDLPVLFDEVWS